MKKIILFFILFTSLNYLYAQSSDSDIVSSGGNHSSNSFVQADWAIGACVFEHYVGKSGNNGNDEIQIDVFPSITSNGVHVEFEENLKGYRIILTNSQGKKLMGFKTKNTSEYIDLSSHANGIYFINVFDKGKMIKSSKIIKIS
ncbi:MAG: T9SS type A sorting domain-containing protein [bacterium]|nr:T9SS type A sorting domain-containing protein [bacterium]